ncbi:g8909 [Coccomyxa viridis]|uniref:G8909 protein n=1 Tax=Coccomyxa viridis TaxID=1274662 RepID=A0ABP1G8A4_9CHLO
MGNNTLIIAVDNSKECLKAVDFALQNFRKGYTYHLLHIQTHPIAASAMVGNADAVGLAYEGQLSFDKERDDASQEFMTRFFIPKASSAGAEE